MMGIPQIPLHMPNMPIPQLVQLPQISNMNHFNMVPPSNLGNNYNSIRLECLTDIQQLYNLVETSDYEWFLE